MTIQNFLYRCMPRKLRRLLPDKTAIEAEFREVFGRELDLANPAKLSEKLQWIKLYDRNPLMVQCSDKYAVREYVRQKGFGHILNELYGVYESAGEIDFAALPDSYVLKATHGSGWNVLVKDGAVTIGTRTRDRKTARSRLKKWLRKSQYLRYREWCYKDIQPRIVCEKYLETGGGSGSLADYKIYCFHGEPKMIQVVVDRPANPQEAFYDIHWRRLDLVSVINLPCQREMEAPACLKEMLEIAAALSGEFLYVRVDLYDLNGNLVFGEMTFYPSYGFLKFTPARYDSEFGKLLKLPV